MLVPRGRIGIVGGCLPAIAAQKERLVVTERRHTSTTRYIWGRWVVASSVSGAAGFALSTIVLDIVQHPTYPGLTEVIVFGLFQTVVGIGQWLVLRDCVVGADRWVGASAAGGILIGIGAGTLPTETPLPVTYGALGAVLGMLQWLVLRQGTKHAAWWLLACPAGWALGTLAVTRLDDLWTWLAIKLPETAGSAVTFGMMSGTAGIFTGAVLAWILSDGELPSRSRIE
jgi:hypothetical protein